MTLIKRSSWPSDPFYEMDRLLNRALGNQDFWPEAYYPVSGRDFPLNVYGEDEQYYVVAELPGIAKDAIDLKVENMVLTISVTKNATNGDSKTQRRMSRSITVGEDIDVDKVAAKLENGLLTVTLPKAEESKPKRITIG